MSNTLTDRQIETFDVFAAAVKDYLDNISDGTMKSSRFVKDKKAFGALWEASSRPSKLAPVMNNLTALEATGSTKSQFQLRTPDGELCYRPDGSRVMSRRHCVMFKAQAYRDARAEITGLKTPECFYYIQWDAAPEWLRTELAKKFPKVSEGVPAFEPKQVGVLLRKGRKPSKGQKRHNWAGFDYLVTGTYGEENAVIVQAFVANKPYVAKLAEVVGCDCPDWGQNDATPQEKEEEVQPLAASGLMDAAKAIL
jgi:hypothetical protein